MQYIAGAMKPHSSSSSATVLVSSNPPGPELTDRMYSDLVTSLIWSRDSAEKRAMEAESRLHELHMRLSANASGYTAARHTSAEGNETG